MTHESKRTTDHDVIRQWVEERGGRPAVVASTYGENGGGILRIDFAEPNDSLEEVSWEEFFNVFDENELTFLYQEETAEGEQSRFFKFVEREPGDTE